MADTPPELVKAYQLIKAGQRQEAAALLKPYLAQNPRDANAWWLMAHAVNQPANAQKCLERVLAIDPTHEKARAKLARLQPPEPAPTPTPIPEPFTSGSSYSAAEDPFSPSGFNPYAPYEDGPVNPFEAAETAQAPGTGNQPEWGPGLGFVADQTPPISRPAARSSKPAPREAKKEKVSVETVIGATMIAVAAVVLLGVLLYALDQRSKSGSGSSGSKKSKYDSATLTTLDGGTFAVDYPEGWNVQCLREINNYPVCGIANHEMYNQVAWYTGGDVDLSALWATFSEHLFSFEDDLPDEQISIVIMNVPRNSPAYDDSSWAKTKHDWVEEGWYLDKDAKSQYDRKEMQVAGLTAYYYKFKSEDRESERDGFWGKDVTYDVYVPQDNGLILWMTVNLYGDIKNPLPENLIETMIESIVFTY